MAPTRPRPSPALTPARLAAVVAVLAVASGVYQVFRAPPALSFSVSASAVAPGWEAGAAS
jgi:hypothetical protein